MTIGSIATQQSEVSRRPRSASTSGPVTALKPHGSCHQADQAATAKQSHAPIQQRPPRGVIMPSLRTDVSAIA